MRKNVNSSKEKSTNSTATPTAYPTPMWYTAAAEYSHKKRIADRLSSSIDDVDTFERRSKFYGRGNVLNPKHDVVVPNSRFAANSYTPPPSRTRSPINAVVAPSRFSGTLVKYQQDRSKNASNVLKGTIAATPRSAGGLYRVPTKGESPTRRTLRNPFKIDPEPAKKGVPLSATKGNMQIPLHLSTNPLVKQSSQKSSQSAKPAIPPKRNRNVASEEDNEEKLAVVPVGANRSQMAQNIVQLIMVEPNTKPKPPVQKISGVRKERLSNGSAPSQRASLSKTSRTSNQPTPQIVEQPTEAVQQEEIAAEPAAEVAAAVVEPADEPQEEPEVAAVEEAAQVVASTENVAAVESATVATVATTDMEDMECPEINIYQCYPNDCAASNPSGIEMNAMMCSECHPNSIGSNLVTSCSVTEEHYLSFESETELQPTVESVWNGMPQYGISHYMYPSNTGQQQASWHTNMQCPRSQEMMQTQAVGRMIPSGRNYAYNRPSCRQQQQQQQQQYNYGNNSCYSMLSPQQQAMSMRQQQQQQLQQQQQQHGLTELLAQQLQQQMQQAQAQISQVQMQLYNACSGVAKMSKGQSVILNAADVASTKKRPSKEAVEKVSTTKELQADAESTARSSQQLQNSMGSPKANVSFCPHPPSICQCAGNAAAPQQQQQQQEQPQSAAVLSLGFPSIEPQASEVSETSAAQNQTFIAAQQQFQPQQQQFQPQQQQQQFQPQPTQFQPQPQQQYQQSPGMIPLQCPGNFFCNPYCRQRYAQMRFMMPRCWQRH